MVKKKIVKKKTSTAKSKNVVKKSSKPKGYQVVGGAKLKDKEIKTSREKNDRSTYWLSIRCKLDT